uniref:TNFR-Cys domain-containing protein n=1 Tax=Globisporangium ultimum (strain ATCC 200006 / CBS 805.95 / DAOM BR144) TaxID=431595 RepID=K3WJP4_GLOUD
MPNGRILQSSDNFFSVSGGYIWERYRCVDHACAPCPEGYYCEMGSIPLTKQVCLPGYFCPEGTKRATQYPCTGGTFNIHPGQKSLAACQLDHTAKKDTQIRYPALVDIIAWKGRKDQTNIHAQLGHSVALKQVLRLRHSALHAGSEVTVLRRAVLQRDVLRALTTPTLGRLEYMSV